MPAVGLVIPPGKLFATSVYTEVETAAPNDIAICLNVPATAFPCESKSIGSALMPQVFIFIITNDAPKFRTHKNTINNQIGDVSVNVLKQKPAIVSTAMPTIPHHLIPYLSKSFPVIGDMIPITIAGGIITRPETVGDIPNTS